MRRAQKTLQVEIKKVGQPGEEDQKWLWSLPQSSEGGQDPLEDPEDDHQKSVATFENSGHLREESQDQKELYEEEL